MCLCPKGPCKQQFSVREESAVVCPPLASLAETSSCGRGGIKFVFMSSARPLPCRSLVFRGKEGKVYVAFSSTLNVPDTAELVKELGRKEGERGAG